MPPCVRAMELTCVRVPTCMQLCPSVSAEVDRHSGYDVEETAGGTGKQYRSSAFVLQSGEVAENHRPAACKSWLAKDARQSRL